MSRVGKKPLKIPEGVSVIKTGSKLKISGPKGELEYSLPSSISAIIKDEEGEILIQPKIKDPSLKKKEISSLWGLSRSIIFNMIEGIVSGFRKELEISGLGYKATKKDRDLVLSLGLSHPITIQIPSSLEVEVSKNKIIISGINKEKVGDFAAYLRSLKKPEPYKGKGISYLGEKIRRKAGKTAKVIQE